MTTEQAIGAALAAETEAIEADLAHRREKALRFIELRREGEGVQDTWKLLEADEGLMRMEKTARVADAKAKAAWIIANQSRTEKEATDDA